MRTSEYLGTDAGRLSRFNRRFQRRLLFDVRGVEPRSKGAMPTADQVELQRQLLVFLQSRRRRAYGGPLVLQVRVATTDKTPPHAQTIAKSLLDLFARPLPGLRTARKALLYRNDSQIVGLSVSCRHGASEPEIRGSAQSLGDFRDDLELALHALESGLLSQDRQPHLATDGLDFQDQLLENAPTLRSRLGEATFEAMLDLARHYSQRDLLGISALKPRDLAALFRAHDLRHTRYRNTLDAIALVHEQLLRDDPFRIHLDELPQEAGGADVYRDKARAMIARFRNRFGRVLVPLRIPVALEVVVKPPRRERRGTLHDLDNVLRNYLIPAVVELLQPPADIAWALEPSAGVAPGADQPPLVGRPRSARVGLVRFDAWRIPRAQEDASPGFVTATLVSDAFGLETSIARVHTLLAQFESAAR